MAFAITNRAINNAGAWPGSDHSTGRQFTATATSTTASGRYFEYADFTSTGPIPLATMVSAGAAGDFASDYQSIRAFVYMKSLTGTTGPPMVVNLEAATSTAYTPHYVLDTKMVSGTSTAAAFKLTGVSPISGGLRYARVTFIAATTSAAVSSATAVDAMIEAV